MRRCGVDNRTIPPSSSSSAVATVSTTASTSTMTNATSRDNSSWNRSTGSTDPSYTSKTTTSNNNNNNDTDAMTVSVGNEAAAVVVPFIEEQVDDDEDDYDIVIVGGGVIGASLVHQLVQLQQQPSQYHQPMLRIAMIESSMGPPPPPPPPPVPRSRPEPWRTNDDNTATPTTATTTTTIPHPRSYALSPASIQLIFGTSGDTTSDTTTSTTSRNNKTMIQDYFGPHEQGYYTSMQVWESHQPACLVWTTNDLVARHPVSTTSTTTTTPSNHNNNNNNNNNNHNNNNDDDHHHHAILGWCMEDSKLQQFLWYKQLQYRHTSSSSSSSSVLSGDDETNNDTNSDATSTATGTNTGTNNVTIYPSTTVSHIQWPNSHNSSSDDDDDDDDDHHNNSIETWVTGTFESTTTTSSSSNTTTDTSTVKSGSTKRRKFRTRLLIAADGSQSKIRQLSGITMEQYNYQQMALTFTVQFKGHSEQPMMTTTTTTHNNNGIRRRAYQRYLENGSVLALLPTNDHSNYGTIVYSTSVEEAQYWKNGAFSNPNNRNDDEHTTNQQQQFIEYLNTMLQTGPERLPSLQSFTTADDLSVPRRIGTNLLYGIEQVINTIQYGMTMSAQQQAPTNTGNDTDNSKNNPAMFHAPPMIEQIVSGPFAFPLSCQIPKQQQYTIDTHFALVGDAAHTIHPMAGQGLNLGLQDVLALANTIMKARNSGMDIGTYLHEYNTSRQIQVSTTVAAIHGLQQLLCNNNIVGKHIKAFGMNCIQNIQPLRQKIVRAACYGV